MRLLSFHADGFGILAQTGAEGLGPGINIFLGDNEAGKSTCLAFLRAMLYGINSRERDRADYIADKNRYAPGAA